MSLPHGLPLFDAVASEAAKDDGRDAAEASLPVWNRNLMEAARSVARALAHQNGTVTADDVVLRFARNRINLTAKLGNAMGSLFRGDEWEFTGRYVKSERVHAHSNLLRVWKLREGREEGM